MCKCRMAKGLCPELVGLTKKNAEKAGRREREGQYSQREKTNQAPYIRLVSLTKACQASSQEFFKAQAESELGRLPHSKEL